MPLTVTEPILASDIVNVRDLKEGKIFMLIGMSGEKLVIKAEPNVTGAGIKMAAPTVKAIDPAIKMKPLRASEVNELAQFARAGIRLAEHVKQYFGDADNQAICDEEKKVYELLKDCVDQYGRADTSGRTNIAKMTAMNMSTLKVAESLAGKTADDQCWDEARETFAKFVKALNKTGGLEKIGEIMAGDAFIGNNDRFAFATVVGQGKQQKGRGAKGQDVELGGEGKKRLKILTNLGNIIVVKEKKGSATRPSMLDYMDPFGSYAKPNYNSVDSAGGDWAMLHLLDPAKRKEMAQYVIDDLEYILKPEKTFFGKSKLGGSKAASRVNDGIVAGIRKVVKANEARQNLPPLVQDKLRIVKENYQKR